MSAAKSVGIYGGYLLASGLLLLLIPTPLLAIAHIDVDTTLWVRLFGLLAAEIGFYFVFASRRKLSAFYLATVYGRIFAAVGIAGLIISGIAPLQLSALVLVDLGSALWTLALLRKE